MEKASKQKLKDKLEKMKKRAEGIHSITHVHSHLNHYSLEEKRSIKERKEKGTLGVRTRWRGGRVIGGGRRNEGEDH